MKKKNLKKWMEAPPRYRLIKRKTDQPFNVSKLIDFDGYLIEPKQKISDDVIKVRTLIIVSPILIIQLLVKKGERKSELERRCQQRLKDCQELLDAKDKEIKKRDHIIELLKRELRQLSLNIIDVKTNTSRRTK